MNSRIVAVLALVVLAAGCGTSAEQAEEEAATPTASSTPSAAASAPASTPASAPTSAPASTPAEEPTCDAEGRYTDYSTEAVADECYTDTILFFHAPWCTECRGFEKAIQSGAVPAGAQILKVDYDTETDLRKKYGVTIQSTFVRVAPDGERVELWSGYGKDKSVDAILENTQ